MTHLLQVLPSVIREVDGEFEIEVDFGESLRLYAANFDLLTIACPIRKSMGGTGSWRCQPLRDLPFRDRLRIVPLPDAYRPMNFLRFYAPTRRRLRAEIEQADTLLFSPHAFVWDWPTVAAREAIRQRRSYVIDADVVYHEVAKVDWRGDEPWRRFAKERILLPFSRRSYRYCLAHSRLALLQGQDVFEAFSSFCANPKKVHHTPVSARDCIADAQLEEKLASLASGRPLKICYVGRCIEMKGPMDWLKCLNEISTRGVEFSAIWLGDGLLLPSVRAGAKELGIADRVQFHGHVADHDEVLRIMRDSDLFVFCHQTPESPRCLVEALASGCPLVGYGAAYPRELVAHLGGGQFATVGDWLGLANILTGLAGDRAKIRDLIIAARASGRVFDRDRSMQRRIDLIREYCSPA